MLDAGVRRDVADGAIPQDRSRSASAMAELFLPLDRLLGCGGDPRLSIDPAQPDLNGYGCRPFPCPDTLSFASSTATSISERAYEHARTAREALMQSAIATGLDAAFDARLEAMRGVLKACLGLSLSKTDVVFSPSGTDSQLQALVLARALLGPGIDDGDRGGRSDRQRHRGHRARKTVIFSAATAHGSRVCKRANRLPASRIPSPASCTATARRERRGRACPARNRRAGSRRDRRGGRQWRRRAASDHGLLETRLAGAERAMPRRNLGALARSGSNRRRCLPDAARPPAAQTISRSRLHGDRHRLEVFHRACLQRRAAGAIGCVESARWGRRGRAGLARIQQSQRLADALAKPAFAFSDPDERWSMAALGSGPR